MNSYFISLFSALLFSILTVTAQDTINNIIVRPCPDIDVFAGSESYTMSYSGVFMPVDSLAASLSISVSNSDTNLLTVNQSVDREFLTFSFREDSIGTSQVTLTAVIGIDTATKSFQIEVRNWQDAFALYVQDDMPSGTGITSQSFPDLGGTVTSADDFVVPTGKTWGISKISTLGSKNVDDLGDVIFTIFSDSLGLPNSIVYLDTIPPSSGYTDPNIVIDLADTVSLGGGTYWLSLAPIMPFNGNAGRWFWDRTADTIGNEYHLIDPGNLFGAGFTTWTGASTVTGGALPNLSFRIFGVGGDTVVANPQNFDAQITADNAIQLSWDTSPVEFYILQKGNAADMLDQFVLLDNTSDSVEFYVDLFEDDLAHNTWYYYSIQSRYGQGISGTILDSVLTLPDTATALAVSDISSESFTARWDILSTENYVLDVGKDSSFTDLVMSNYMITGSSMDSFLVTGLESNTTYYYRLAGENSAGQGEYSNIIKVLTLPAAPLALEASAIAATTFQANWDLVSTDHYVIDIARDMSFSDLLISDSIIANSLIDSLIVADLESNTIYYVRLSGANASGQGMYSNTVMALTLPAAPLALEASEIEATSFQANWEALSTDDYVIDVARDMDFTDVIISEFVIAGSSEVSFIVSGLDANATYYYRLSGSNASGQGEHSNTVVARTAGNPTGLDDQLTIHTDVWPNPMTNRVNMTLNRPKVGDVYIRLVNQAGVVVRKQQVRNTGAELSVSWDVNDLARGIYMLTVSMDEWTESVRLIK